MKQKEAAFIKFVVIFYVLNPFAVGLVVTFARNLIVFIGMVMNASGFESSRLEFWRFFINGVKFGFFAELVGGFVGIPIMWLILSKMYKVNITR